MKKFLKAAGLSWLVYKIMDGLIHAVIFKNDYAQMADVYRVDMMDYLWVFFIGSILVVFAMTKLYTLLREDSRCFFGLLMPFIIMIPAAFYTWASIDISLMFTLKWFVLGLIQVYITVKVMAKIYGGCECKKCHKKNTE